MAAAATKVDGVVGRPALVKALGLTPVLSNTNNAGVTAWLWEVVFAPAGTTATLATPTGATSTYGPLDAAGTYHLRLSVNGASGDWQADTEVDEIVVRVRDVGIGLVIPAVGETVQGGAQGWADEINGLNETLARLAAAVTLQGSYDNSAPPRILVTAALGPVALARAVASPGNVLIIGDDTLSTRVQIPDTGRVSVQGNAIAGGTVLTLANDVDGAHAGYLLQALDPAGSRGLTLSCKGALLHYATSGGAYGWHSDVRGAGAGLLLIEDGAGSGGDPVDFTVRTSGGIDARSKGTATALDVDGKACVTRLLRVQDSAGGAATGAAIDLIMSAATGQVTLRSDAPTFGLLITSEAPATGLVRFDNSALAPNVGRVDVDPYGGMKITQSDPGPADPALWITRAGASTANLLHVENTTVAAYHTVEDNGQVITQQRLLAATYGFLHQYAAAPSATAALRGYYDSVLGYAWALYGSCAVYHVPEGLGTTKGAGTTNWYEMDLATVAIVAAGEVRRGIYIDGTGQAIAGEQDGIRVDLAANTGTARCYHASVDDQDAIAAYGVSDAGVAYIGYDHFCIADAGPSTGTWTYNPLSGTGAGATLSADAASRFVMFPVHVPPGCTITKVNVHVHTGGAGVINAFFIRYDDTDDVNADQQTQIATAVSAGAAEQDVTMSGLAEVVAKQGAAAQPAYYVLVESGNAGDLVYSGSVVYSYTEVLHGD